MFLIIKVVIFLPLYSCFNYLIPLHTVSLIGYRVLIPFKNRIEVGIIINYVKKNELNNKNRCNLKKIFLVIDNFPVYSKKFFLLLYWCEKFYHIEIPILMYFIVPNFLKKGNNILYDYIFFWKMINKKIDFYIKNIDRTKYKLIVTKIIKKKKIINEKIKKIRNKKNFLCNKYQKKIFIFLKKYYFKNFFFSIDILKKNKIFYLNKNYILEINNIFVKKKLFKPWLLTEICDFKKLETYLFLSFSIIKKGLQGLILVESMHSSFVLQLKKNLKIRFKIHVEEYHSNISIKKYNNIWKIIRKKIPVIIISTKEGIFLPMENLGIIIVNNESSIEYKIKNRWFCNARNIAIVRAKKENIPILLESYRWNISSKKNVLDKKYYFINLYNLYKKNVKRQKKIIFIYSNREQYKGIFSLKLIQKTEYYLKKNKNVLFIVNKSFFSIFNILKCKKCKYIEKCTVCNQYYRFYDHYQELFCHFCFVRKNIYFLCTKCNTHSLFSERIGISFIKKNLNKFFYKKNIIYIYNKKNLLEVKKKLNSKSILRLQTPSIIFLCDDFVCNFWIQDISFIAFLSLDYLKYSNKFRQLEYFVQKYEVLHSKINYHSYISEILIQIFEKNIFLINFFSKGYNYFLEQTFRFRKINSLPPFSYHIVMFFNDKKIKKIKFLIFFLKNFINQNNNFFIMDLIILESDNIQFNKYKKYYYFKILLSYNNLKKIHYFVNKIILLIKNNKIFRSILIKVDSDPIDN